MVRNGDLVGLASGLVLGRHTLKISLVSKVTSNRGAPRGAGGVSSGWSFPNKLFVLGHRTLPLEDLRENTRMTVSVRHERRYVLRPTHRVATSLRHHPWCERRVLRIKCGLHVLNELPKREL